MAETGTPKPDDHDPMTPEPGHDPVSADPAGASADTQAQASPEPDLDDLVGFASAGALDGRRRVVEPHPSSTQDVTARDAQQIVRPEWTAPTAASPRESAPPGPGPRVSDTVADGPLRPVHEPMRERSFDGPVAQRQAEPVLRPAADPAPPLVPPVTTPAPPPPSTPQSAHRAAPTTAPPHHSRSSAAPVRQVDQVFRSRDQEIEGQTGLFGLYTLILLIVPTVGVAGVLAVLVILGRSRPQSELARSHDTYQRRTIWIAAGVAVLGILLLAAPFALGPLTLFLMATWVIIRGAYGLWMLKSGLPIPRPTSLWIR
ncbi:MAG: hypothetical protein HZY74_02895 [Brevundimonas sp.]|nr:MAG: hypothetical protein HZY74_02895 [Brevundimonas sp.]